MTKDEIADVKVNMPKPETGSNRNNPYFKDRNVLKEYLENKEQEVVDIMMTLFDDEQILKAYTKDIEDNKEKETERKTAERMM